MSLHYWLARGAWPLWAAVAVALVVLDWLGVLPPLGG